MNVVRTIAALRQTVRARRPGARVAFVPTMGALHVGHAALLRAGQHAGDELVASIFVNPKQFNDPQDLARYPRPETADLEIARSTGVHTMFIPSAAEMYPEAAATTLQVAGAAEGFEGSHRPGHFNGVALVCLKLFLLVEPDVVLLGQKDAQQVAVLCQLVRDLNLDVRIDVIPTVRDIDGLALSSRNARLSPDERQRALAIPRALRAALAAHRQGADPVDAARRELAGLPVDYVAVAHFDTPTLVVAATVGTTRLIDNVPLDAPHRAGFTEPGT
jgi:pantoate--beta-alanine ligase